MFTQLYEYSDKIVLVANTDIGHHCTGAIFMTKINKTCLKVPIVLYFNNHWWLYYKETTAVVSMMCINFVLLEAKNWGYDDWAAPPPLLRAWFSLYGDIHVRFLSRENYIAREPILATVR